VRLNQCPHNLDIFQWMFGMPVTLSANCALGEYHDIEVLQNFTHTILDGEKLVAPAPGGISSVELANSMLLSAWTQKPGTLPIDGKKYERLLKAKIASSAKSVNEIGYTAVRISGFGPIPEVEIVALCKAEGLTIRDTHENGPSFLDETDQVNARLAALAPCSPPILIRLASISTIPGTSIHSSRNSTSLAPSFAPQA
jgi:hypothetical protein